MILYPKRYYVRQNALKILSKKFIAAYNEADSSTFKIEKLNVPVKQLAGDLYVSEHDLRLYCSSLATNKEIEYEYDHNSNEEVVRICPSGFDAYSDNKYSNIGQKLRLDQVFDYFKLISGILLLFIAIYTFIINISDTRSNNQAIQSLQEKVILLQQEVEQAELDK